jgi:hypothetical protein
MDLKIDDLNRELAHLKASYALALQTISETATKAITKVIDGTVSSHDAFNMSATCQELAALAGKIEQTQNVIRWMSTEAK